LPTTAAFLSIPGSAFAMSKNVDAHVAEAAKATLRAFGRGAVQMISGRVSRIRTPLGFVS
jgi:hypothetical protein